MVFSEVLARKLRESVMMCAMRLIAAIALSILIAGCAGTAAAPSATPLATSSSATATSVPTSSASGTQATTAALACTAPAQPLVELTEGDSIYSSRMLVTLNTGTSPVTGTFTFVVKA